MVAMADGAKIFKVLPHLLDKNGKHSVAPSLFQRDAYQSHLRQHPLEVSTQRFDVQWRNAKTHDTPLKLRLHLRLENTKNNAPTVIDSEVQPTNLFSRWSSVMIPAETYKRLGRVISWQMELLSGEVVVARQKSFLW